MIKVQTDIPIPPMPDKREIYPFKKMNVGDSFEYPGNIQAAQSAASGRSRALTPKKIPSRYSRRNVTHLEDSIMKNQTLEILSDREKRIVLNALGRASGSAHRKTFPRKAYETLFDKLVGTNVSLANR